MAFREHRILTELQPEIYNPDSNTWAPFGLTKKRQSYHMIFHASDGKLYSPGPNRAGKDSTWRLNPATGAWSLYATNSTDPLDDTVGGILYRPGELMKCGGLTQFAIQGNTNSLPTGGATSGAWRPSVNKLPFSRADHVLNMLPTGGVIATGGVGQGSNSGNANPEDDLARKRPTLWDPTYKDPGQPGKVGWWYITTTTLGDSLAAEPVTRGHHSSAVILPDGRILSGGGWDAHPHSVKSTVDQYSPPYLFEPDGDRAVRPRLYGAQDHITWTQDFKVTCPDAVAAACLIRPGATTHAFNQDVRYVPLEKVSQDGHRVTLRFPAGTTADLAPPGNYLLFVLKNDDGRKVPSMARWVNVSATQNPSPTYATWDTLPPAVITNLAITNVTATSHTLQWTAPSDAGDGSSGNAARYELRYRVGGSMPTLEDFFTAGTSVVGLPAPSGAGQVQTFTVQGTNETQTYFFRIISRDGAGSDRNWSALSNEVSTPSGSGGCPFVDTKTAAGWEIENSILGRSLTGALALDAYRLRHAPEVADGRVRLRVREDEQERTTLDQVRLVAVDHEPGVRAWAVGDEVILGTRAPAARVTTAAGEDLTALFTGSGEGFQGGPGDTLLVELGAEDHLAIGEEQKATLSHDPFHIDDGGKCPPDCGAPLRSPADPFTATAIDAQVLGNSGIKLQVPDGLGGWRTVVTRYPREHPDEAVLEGMGHGPVRMVFVGRHTVRALGRVVHGEGAWSATELPLLAARHSRLGDVHAAVDTTGNLKSELSPGDEVQLEFGWVPVPEGQVRELFFLSHGVYTASLPALRESQVPERFAFRVPRPNPFAGSTTFHFDLPQSRRVRLEVLDAQGRRVRVLAREFAAGSHTLAWDGRNEAGGRAGPGMYFYRFAAGEHRAEGRITRVP